MYDDVSLVMFPVFEASNVVHRVVGDVYIIRIYDGHETYKVHKQLKPVHEKYRVQ